MGAPKKPGHEPGPSTQSVHGGRPKPRSGHAEPAAPSIHPAVVFSYADFDSAVHAFTHPGSDYVYSRYEHPTGVYVENRMASLEKTDGAVLFSSGMAAIGTCVLCFCKSGDRMVASTELYGGTSTLLKRLHAQQGVTVDFVSPEDLYKPETYVPDTRLVLVESPANPLTSVVDFKRLMQALPEPKPLTVLDGTFATPLAQRGAEFGFDLVVHSATKFLGGHDDLLAGVVCGHAGVIEPLRESRKFYGPSCDPNTAWLLDRGLKTLAIRWERHCANAMAVAQHLEQHAAVNWVKYPGLPSHPQYAIAQKQMKSFGAVLAFDVAGGYEAARRVFDGVQWILRAPSLGGVESTLLHPATSSHRELSPEAREAVGISDGTLRLSVGIEDVQDLIADLDQALSQ